jgi:hypothetical protein
VSETGDGVESMPTAENDAPRYRIDFTIYRNDVEVGYGASTPERSVNDALYALSSIVENRLWETTRDMPDPYDVERVIPPGRGRDAANGDAR